MIKQKFWNYLNVKLKIATEVILTQYPFNVKFSGFDILAHKKKFIIKLHIFLKNLRHCRKRIYGKSQTSKSFNLQNHYKCLKLEEKVSKNASILIQLSLNCIWIFFKIASSSKSTVGQRKKNPLLNLTQIILDKWNLF